MDVLVASEEKIRQIVTECLENHRPAPEPKPEPESKFIFSIRGLAEFLNCSPVTAQKLKNSGKIRYRQYNRKVVFNSAEVLEDLKNKKRG